MPRMLLTSIDAAPTREDLERRAEWRAKVVARLQVERQARLDALEQQTSGIEAALQAYQELDDPDRPWVTLRRQFVRLAHPRVLDDEDDIRELTDAERVALARRERASRPPATRTVYRNSRALALYLTAVFVAQMEVDRGQVVKNERRNTRQSRSGLAHWSRLAGFSTPRDERAKRQRMRRALDQLEEARLVSLGPKRTSTRYEGWQLLNDDGHEGPYRVPAEKGPGVLRLPSTFFLRGWHLVLDPLEIAMLLAIWDMSIRHRTPRQSAAQGKAGIVLGASVRETLYGLSDEAYFTGQQLFEFGIAGFTDPMPTRRRGKIKRPIATSGSGSNEKAPLPYQYYPPELSAFDRPALEVVRERLQAFPTPLRLHSEIGLMSPEAVIATEVARTTWKR